MLRELLEAFDEREPAAVVVVVWGGALLTIAVGLLLFWIDGELSLLLNKL